MRFIVTFLLTLCLSLVFATPVYSPVYFYNMSISAKVRPNVENVETVSHSGQKKTIEVIATAYTPWDKGCTGITYTGKQADYGVIAVDPKIIPLHTKVYVPGYGFAVAEDIGGAIKGNRIDVCIPDKKKALEWGVRNIVIEIIR